MYINIYIYIYICSYINVIPVFFNNNTTPHIASFNQLIEAINQYRFHNKTPLNHDILLCVICWIQFVSWYIWHGNIVEISSYFTKLYSCRWRMHAFYSSAKHFNPIIDHINLTHCWHIFPWLCIWCGCIIVFCQFSLIYPGKSRFLFALLLCSLWWGQILEYIKVWRSDSYSFFCTLHSWSPLYGLSWMHCNDSDNI